ncbi:hypothetical protein IAR55_002416 [Kwoniella newhampshirensis]|uniref:Uncharacterized protein n=1 Tax=Kwoniella newhampshirensis TaxID=1651941 RepID=A0AAW0Z192_9TREE
MSAYNDHQTGQTSFGSTPDPTADFPLDPALMDLSVPASFFPPYHSMLVFYDDHQTGQTSSGSRPDPTADFPLDPALMDLSIPTELFSPDHGVSSNPYQVDDPFQYDVPQSYQGSILQISFPGSFDQEEADEIGRFVQQDFPHPATWKDKDC